MAASMPVMPPLIAGLRASRLERLPQEAADTQWRNPAVSGAAPGKQPAFQPASQPDGNEPCSRVVRSWKGMNVTSSSAQAASHPRSRCPVNERLPNMAQDASQTRYAPSASRSKRRHVDGS